MTCGSRWAPPWRTWIHLPAPSQRCRQMRPLTYARRRHASDPKVPKRAGPGGGQVVRRPLSLGLPQDDVSGVVLGASAGVVRADGVGAGGPSTFERTVDDAERDRSHRRPRSRTELLRDALGPARPRQAPAAPGTGRPLDGVSAAPGRLATTATGRTAASSSTGMNPSAPRDPPSDTPLTSPGRCSLHRPGLPASVPVAAHPRANSRLSCRLAHARHSSTRRLHNPIGSRSWSIGTYR